MARYTELVEEAQRLLKRSEKDSWRLAELTWEAVKDKGKTQREWGADIGRSQSTVKMWLKIWAAYGEHISTQRPSFHDAMLEMQGGGDIEGERTRVRGLQVQSALRDLSQDQAAHVVAKVMRDRPELAEEVVRDVRVRAIVGTAIDSHHRESPPRAVPKAEGDPTLEMVAAMVDMDRSMARLIENANGARRQGFLAPSSLREFAEKLRLYADAIDSIANSRGLTDDALAEWIGEDA